MLRIKSDITTLYLCPKNRYNTDEPCEPWTLCEEKDIAETVKAKEMIYFNKIKRSVFYGQCANKKPIQTHLDTIPPKA